MVLIYSNDWQPSGQFGAKRELAIAIRKNHPVRGANIAPKNHDVPTLAAVIAPLAEMLIAGEGGPADLEARLVPVEGSFR